MADVSVAGQYRAPIFLCAIGCADLYQLWFRRDGSARRALRLWQLIAIGVGASVTLPSEVIAEQQFVVAGAFGAVGTTASGGNKLGVALVERRIFQRSTGYCCQSRIAGYGQATGYGRVSIRRCRPLCSKPRARLLADRRAALPTATHGLRQSHRHRTLRRQRIQGRSISALEATKTGDLPTFTAICSMLYLGSSKASNARNPCASSIG